MKLTARECHLIALLHPGVETIKRQSDREFDLHIEGKDGIGRFGAWLVLSAISGLTDWTCRHIAKLTDYPEMCESGDWSGMRDTDNDKLWHIFTVYALPQSEQLAASSRRAFQNT